MDQENLDILGTSQLSRSLIERIQHEHIHKEKDNRFVRELVRVVQLEKPRLGRQNQYKRKLFCDFALYEIKENKAVFIANDKCYYEIQNGIRKKSRRITREKGTQLEAILAPQTPTQFIQMYWAYLSSEPIIGPQHLWESLTPEERKLNKVALINENL